MTQLRTKMMCGECRKWKRFGKRKDDKAGRQFGICAELDILTDRCTFCRRGEIGNKAPREPGEDLPTQI